MAKRKKKSDIKIFINIELVCYIENSLYILVQVYIYCHLNGGEKTFKLCVICLTANSTVNLIPKMQNQN